MYELNEPVPESTIVHELEEAIDFAEQIGFPIIVRPAYTLAEQVAELLITWKNLTKLYVGGLKESPITSMFN